MKTKLTLSIDKDLVEFAHRQARTSQNSISAMFSEYLRQRRAQPGKAGSPSVADMVGVLKHYPVDDSKQAMRAMYAKKHSG